MAAYSTDRFIAEVKKRPALWNSYCEEYEHRKIQKKYWDEIFEIFRDDSLNAHERKIFENALKLRWKSIRGSFARELKRQKLLKRGCKAGYKTEYIHFKQLKFLSKVVALKEPIEPADTSPNRVCQVADRIVPDLDSIDVDELIGYSSPTETTQPNNDEMFTMLTSSLKNAPNDIRMLTKYVLDFIADDATSGT